MSPRNIDLKLVGSLPEPEMPPTLAESVTALAWRLVGPLLVRQIEETRAVGTADTEILDELLKRLREGWYDE